VCLKRDFKTIVGQWCTGNGFHYITVQVWEIISYKVWKSRHETSQKKASCVALVTVNEIIQTQLGQSGVLQHTYTEKLLGQSERFYRTMAVRGTEKYEVGTQKLKRKRIESPKHQRDEIYSSKKGLISKEIGLRNSLTHCPQSTYLMYTNWCESGKTCTDVSQSAFPLHLHASTWLLPCGGWSQHILISKLQS